MQRFFSLWTYSFISVAGLLAAGCSVVHGDTNSKKLEPIVWTFGDAQRLTFSNKLKQEFFASKNIKLLNDDNCFVNKTIVPGKFTWDMYMRHTYRNEACGWNSVVSGADVRIKGIYGAPEAGFKTAPHSTSLGQATVDRHTHPLSLHLPAFRAVWTEIAWNDMLGLTTEYPHTFTAGLFPFSLGRGIALGSAFAVTPDFIGYDPASSVEQYAPGFKFSGMLREGLGYDAYAEIADNKAYSFDAVNANIKGQLYGHQFNQARQFGEVNYILAGRLRVTPVDDVDNSVYFEPYALFNDEREQNLEIRGDASTKLGTVGLMSENRHGSLSYGFDVAFNIGRQQVAGLDRNTVKIENRDGVPTFVNSHVIDTATGKKALYIPGSDNQGAINEPMAQSSLDSALSVNNGEDVAGALNLQHAKDRYRDPYENRLHGWMGVCDVAYTFEDPDVVLAATAGYASGDENPNKDLNELGESERDGVYGGFISLQELYSGQRVKSAFLLSGQGKIPRVLSFPNRDDQDLQGSFPSQVTRFSNIGFAGASARTTFTNGSGSWDVQPNILSYWQPTPTRVFLQKEGVRGSKAASRYLGTEVNVYVDGHVMPGVKLFVVGGLFAPGGHFSDIAGRPLNKAQQKVLEAPNVTGVRTNRVPVLGNNTSVFLNTGLELRF